MFPHRSSKPGKRGFGQRRTVVQLKDEPRRQPTYGFGYKPADEVVKPEATSNALSGLMSQYAMDSFSDDNSDDDDGGEKLEEESASHTNDHRKERKQWPQFVAATDTQLPAFQVSDPVATGEKAAKSHEPTATEPSSAVSVASSEGKDDIDTKLKDFLAEIESLEVTEKPASTESTTDEKKPLETAVPDCDVENGVGTSEDDLNAPVEPKPPATVWQYCLDEGTQCYYYWNTDTNDVTWEIPPGYSQYLLRHKEYERLLAKYEKEMAEWRKIHGTKKSKKTTKKKDRKRRKKVEDGDEVIEPLVSYPPIEEEEEEGEAAANDNGAPVVYGPEKPPDEVLERQAQNDLKEPEQDPVKQIVEMPENEERGDGKHGGVSVAPETVALTAEGDSVLLTSVKKHHHKSSKRHSEEEVSSLKHGDKTVSRVNREPKAKPLDSGSKVKPQSDQLSDGRDRKPDRNPEVDSKIQDTVTISASPGKPDVEEIDDEEEFINRELEDPVFTHYEYVNKKFTDDQNDDTEFAIEEIDRELELALEKQQTEIDAYSGDRKRKPEFMEDPSVSSAKRQKTDTFDASHLVGGTFASLKEDIKFKVNELTEVLDLSSTIMEKFEFLEVPPCDWSNLQVLLIQMETRLMDWKFGGLNTDYMLQKLHEAAGVLRQYEQTSCPPGWSCCWDRDFKRYFYNNIITGETSWRYPEVGGDEEKSCRDPGTSNAFKEGTETITKSSVIAGFNPNLQISDDNGIILAVPASEPSGHSEEPDLSISIPSDLLTWAANPPPPPPETPPPSSLCSETEMPQHSPVQTSDNEKMADDDDDCVCLDDEPPPTDEEDHHHHHHDLVESTTSDPESAFVITAHQTLPDQNIAGASAGSPPLPGIPAAASPEGSVDNGVSAASAVTAQPLTYDDQYDGTPMEEQIAHPIKEKKKKKEKLSLGSSLSMKKKNVSSLVEKWQKIQDDVSKEIEQERSKQLKLAELAGKATSSKTE